MRSDPMGILSCVVGAAMGTWCLFKNWDATGMSAFDCRWAAGLLIAMSLKSFCQELLIAYREANTL